MDSNKDHEKIKRLALEFLKAHKTAVVATASRSCEPQAATVFYSIDDDFTFNFVTDRNSRKYKNLLENPYISIVVGVGPEVVTIQCGGHAELVDYAKETARAIKITNQVIINSKLYFIPPSLPVLMNLTVELGIFIVKPSWMVMLDLEYQKDPQTFAKNYQRVLP